MDKQWLEAQAAFTPLVGKGGQGSVAFVLMAIGRKLRGQLLSIVNGC